MVLRVRIGALDLNETFRANRLVTASGTVEIRRIVKEADRTLACVFVQSDFNRLSIDKWVFGKLQFPR